MDKLKHFIISDIINNTKETIKSTTLISSKNCYVSVHDTEVQHGDFKQQLKIDLELLSASTLFLIHKAVLNKN